MSYSHQQIEFAFRQAGVDFAPEDICGCFASGATPQEYIPIAKAHVLARKNDLSYVLTRDDIVNAFTKKGLDFTSANVDYCLELRASPDNFAPIVRRQAAERAAMARLKAADDAEEVAKAKRSENWRKKYPAVFDGGICP